MKRSGIQVFSYIPTNAQDVLTRNAVTIHTLISKRREIHSAFPYQRTNEKRLVTPILNQVPPAEQVV